MDPDFLSPEEMESRIRAIFQDADKDGNGILDRKEFKSVSVASAGMAWCCVLELESRRYQKPQHTTPFIFLIR